MLSLDNCEISYEDDDILQAKFASVSDNSFVDANVISDIKYYALRHSVKEGEAERLQEKIDRADLCLGYSREDVIQNNITECTVKGSEGPGGPQANILGLPHYSTTPIVYNLDVNDFLI